MSNDNEIKTYSYGDNSGPGRWVQLEAAVEAAGDTCTIVNLHWGIGRGVYTVYPTMQAAMAELDRWTGDLVGPDASHGRRTSECYVDLTPDGLGYAESYVRIVHERETKTTTTPAPDSAPRSVDRSFTLTPSVSRPPMPPRSSNPPVEDGEAPSGGHLAAFMSDDAGAGNND